MDQGKLKTLTFTIGGLSLLVAGLFYTLVTDLFLLNSAEWLLIAIFTAFGGGFCALLSEGLRNNHIWFYVVKGIGVLCSVVFIIIIFRYSATIDVLTVVKAKGIKTDKVHSTVNFVKTVCLILAFTGVVFQGGNIVFNVIYKIDD